MKLLEERIRKDGIIKEGNVLKVDRFLNHQMDIELFQEIGKEFKRRFEGKEINKILTIEASGIGIACITAGSLCQEDSDEEHRRRGLPHPGGILHPWEGLRHHRLQRILRERRQGAPDRRFPGKRQGFGGTGSPGTGFRRRACGSRGVH